LGTRKQEKQGVKNMNELPNMEPNEFLIEDGRFYYMRDNQRYHIKNMTIVANGTRDLCVAIAPNGSPIIMTTNDANKHNREIVLIPKTDLIQMEIDRPVHGQGYYLILEVTPEIKEMLKVVLKHTKIELTTKGKDFHMYSGENYL
jgi:hypothetical protein